ncbi:TetR/AcrR family transcriptional regulator C-terminal domain-containing protein [Nonomuraea jiangxiensis]|uniref:TetR/AcrR family transcriptional regulator, tetracycline repressor protein n=1 Tax=Nonomuraea jiangxiensis TaxID=633440 RepID=A0A1G8JBV3_9ACTN|nr:TetR/AcrR family transcriptional regulator C-terminal domain-containing protein [Nonomuraea jiangxiensis]SDI28563.1 TetR/AcrR family transcriptional regulator, tetracycline repressor protein [Nonomuraea jiangxiensis]
MDVSKRPGLSRQTLIDTALRLLDEVGLDGLTVRRLAAELGVKSPALYWHIRTKQELLDGMADSIVQAAGMGPPRDGEPWQDWLARRARAYRASLAAYRDGARVVTNARALSPATIQAFEEELTAMVERGFTPVLALRTVATLSQYVNGFVLQEQSAPDAPAVPPSALLEDAGRSTLVTAVRETGTLRAALLDGGGSGGEQTFEHGLQVLIDGTAAALARTSNP